MKKPPLRCQVWKLGTSSTSPRAQWTGEYLYLLTPEGQEQFRLTKAQTRSLFVHLKGLYRD